MFCAAANGRFSRLISFSNAWVKSGFVQESDLGHVWRELNADDVAAIMRLFAAYGVAFAQVARGCWIVPSMLPAARPGPPLPWQCEPTTRRHERVFQMVRSDLRGVLHATLTQLCRMSCLWACSGG